MLSSASKCVPSDSRTQRMKHHAASRRVRDAAGASIESLEYRTLLSTTLQPVADTFVRNHDYALTNFGASPDLFVKTAASLTSGGDTRYAYLKFDLTGVTTINSAVLQLSGSLQNRTSPAVVTGVYAIPDSTWIEGNGNIVDSIGDGYDTSNNPPGEITWNNRPQPLPDATPIATAPVTRDTFQTISFDVTSYLQQQLAAGNTSVSLMLENTAPSAEETKFLSREAASNVGMSPAPGDR